LIFAVSFVLTVLSFVLGMANISFGGHGGIGHGHVGVGDGLHVGHAHVDGPHGVHLGHVDAGHGIHLEHAPHAATDHGFDGEGASPFNMATALAFFTWFGGAGYLLTAHLGVPTLIAIALATIVGLVGAAVVFVFMVRVLLPGQTPYLSSDDYDLAGTIGRLTVGIRESGTGELVYSKGGTRRVASARSENGEPIARGEEVVVVREEGGIAYVEPFASFMKSAAPESARR
jgi:membrane protein implicated in regulation of membrane protease activity